MGFIQIFFRSTCEHHTCFVDKWPQLLWGKDHFLKFLTSIRQHTLLPVHYYTNAIMLLLLHTSFQVNPANTTECLAGTENSLGHDCVS